MTNSCPNCGTENEQGNRFCFNCGTNLAEAPEAEAAPTTDAGERRLVSVVFADLVGFTTFSEHRDPEEVRGMLTRYYERCRDIIGRYGGTTDKFIGDAVMGVWGAVEAHEDDAERATRAAMELVDMVEGLGVELGHPDLAARAGVLSGEASVGSGGNEHGLVVGDLVNTASRLQSIAPPGGVYVGQSTHDLVRGSIEFEPAGEHEVKGKQDNVAAFSAVRVLALSTSQRGGEHSEGPFVGRDDELRLLKDQLHATERERRSRMVLVTGQAGIGKTRLSQELVRYIDGITETVYYHSGRSPSYGDGVTFWALGEMIRQRAGILEGEDAAKSRMKLRTCVAEYVEDPSDQSWIEPRLAAVIGLAESPTGSDASEFRSALRAFFQHISERGPVLMVFEDVHWADDGLLDFVEELVDRSTDHPIFVLALARPELLERRPRFGHRQGNTWSLPLRPLHADALVELLLALSPDIEPARAELIAERSGGIPLHAVEFARMHADAGELDDDAIPDGVSAVIGARLDRLPSEDQALVADASVLGLAFTPGALARLSGKDPGDVSGMLDALVGRDVFEFDDDPRSPERGQYRFVQSLIREVAYGRIAKSRRVQLHLAVAEWHEGDPDPELAGVIASHYRSAVEADPNDDELRRKARDAVLSAADRARSLHSDQQAAALYLSAAEVTRNVPAGRRMRLDAARALDDSGRFTEASDLAELVLDESRDDGDDEGAFDASIVLGEIWSGGFRAAEAAELLLDLYDKTPKSRDRRWVEMASQAARACALSDRSEDAERISNEVIPVADSTGLVDILLDTLINKGTAVMQGERRLEGQVLLQGVAQVARSQGLMDIRARALNNHWASISSTDGRSYEHLENLAEAIERAGNESWYVRLAFQANNYHNSNGDPARALEALDLVKGHDLSGPFVGILSLLSGASVLLRDGYTAEVGAEVRQAAEQMRESGDRQAITFAAQYLAGEAFAAGDYERAFDVGRPAVVVDWLYPHGPEQMIKAAALLRDAARVGEALEVVGVPATSAHVTKGLVLYGEALRAALAGDVEASESAFSAAEDIWDVRGPMLPQAQFQTIWAGIIGTDRPAGAAAAQRARAFAESHDLPLLDALIDECLGSRVRRSEAG